MPALRLAATGEILTQSNAILEFMEEAGNTNATAVADGNVAPRLMPTDLIERARVRQVRTVLGTDMLHRHAVRCQQQCAAKKTEQLAE